MRGARAGRAGRIRAKLNGLDDPEIIVDTPATIYDVKLADASLDLAKRGRAKIDAALAELVAIHPSLDGRVFADGAIPQFINVLKGEMSLVGPRPEVPRYVDLNNPLWKLVLEARPGITDPMTLSLRNEEALLASVNADCEEFYLNTLQPLKLQGYLTYLRERSFWQDVRVLMQTCGAVVMPRSAPARTIQGYSKNTRLN